MSSSIVAVVLIAFVFLIILLAYIPIGLWIKASSLGVNIRLMNIIGMRLRMVDPKRIINAMVKAKEAGIDLHPDYVEAQHLAGGNVDRMVQILIDAQNEGVDLSFQDACIIDLNGYDFETYRTEHGLPPKLL